MININWHFFDNNDQIKLNNDDSTANTSIDIHHHNTSFSVTNDDHQLSCTAEKLEASDLNINADFEKLSFVSNEDLQYRELKINKYHNFSVKNNNGKLQLTTQKFPVIIENLEEVS